MQTDTQTSDNSEHIFDEFKRYLALSDHMIAISSKEALAKTARILAMQAAHYAAKYGDEPMLDLATVVPVSGLSEDSAAFLRDGAKTFVGVLGVVAGGLFKDTLDPVQ
ncbi:MAG: hypothetical protein K2X64_07100 [Rhodocyclaceae bacterium]|nr:hypothetical protein [Rhodocyclaceae bacterium]